MVENEFDDADRVLDVGDYHRKRRIKDLLDARKQVRETKTRVEQELHADRRFSILDARKHYRTALTGYLQELQPLMTVTYPEKGNSYWEDLDLGTFKVYPPDASGSTPGHGGYTITKDELPPPKEFQLTGLNSILTFPSPVTVRFDLPDRCDRIKGFDGDPTTRSEIPRDNLDLAFQEANSFLAEIGLTLEAEDELPLHDLG
jgi:hypothetical protein